MESVREKNEECYQFLPGVLAYKAEEFEDAVDSFNEFISMYPNSPNNQVAVDFTVSAYKEWALTLRADSQYEEAVGKYSSVIDRHLISSSSDPVFGELVTTYQEWVDALLAKDMYSQSIEVYKMILGDKNLVSFHPEIVNDIGDVYLDWSDHLGKQGIFDESADVLNDLLMDYPSSNASQRVIPLLGEIYMGWGESLRKVENFDESIEKYNVALESYIQEPDTNQSVQSVVGEIYLEWGDALRKDEKFDESIEKYNTALASYVQTPEAIREVYALISETYLEWGNALRDKGLYEEAIDKYEIVLDEYDQSPAAFLASDEIPMIYIDIGTQQYQDGKFLASLDTLESIKTLTQKESILSQAASEFQNALKGLAKDSGDEGQMILSQAFNSACSGEPAVFPLINSDEAKPGKILICKETEKEFIVPDDLLASYPAHLRFVTKAYLKWHTIDSCSYHGGFTLHRRRYYWTVQLIDASTGVLFASEKFYGSEPGNCPQKFTFSNRVGYLSGEKPSMEIVIAWINDLLK
jgi:tetratricopeptide (TPR) repeat protein